MVDTPHRQAPPQPALPRRASPRQAPPWAAPAIFRLLAGALALGLGGLLAACPARDGSEPPFITVASTTSTENSGLFAHILPQFTAATGIEVRVVAKGTGQAIRIAQGGDADVLLVHHRPSEERFVREGFGVKRYGVMYNDFVLVGPRADPAGVFGTKDPAAAFARIAQRGATFASRGDDSGTHKTERAIWKAAGIMPQPAAAAWYKETGSGMGATLNTAAAMGAYTLTDRGSWLAFKNPRELALAVQGDPRLFNPYGVILVNPSRFAHVKAAQGQAFIDWLISPAGQEAIGTFRKDGRPLFFPNAKSQ